MVRLPLNYCDLAQDVGAPFQDELDAADAADKKSLAQHLQLIDEVNTVSACGATTVRSLYTKLVLVYIVQCREGPTTCVRRLSYILVWLFLYHLFIPPHPLPLERVDHGGTKKGTPCIVPYTGRYTCILRVSPDASTELLNRINPSVLDPLRCLAVP